MVGRKPALSESEAEELYREYSRWLQALETCSPLVLAKRFGIGVSTVKRYGRLRQKNYWKRAA